MSICPRKKDLSSLVLPEVSYFPCLGFWAFPYLVRGSKGRGCHNCTVCRKPSETICKLWFWALQMKFDLIWFDKPRGSKQKDFHEQNWTGRAGETISTRTEEICHLAWGSEDNKWTDSWEARAIRCHMQTRTSKLTGKTHGQGQKAIVFYQGREKEMWSEARWIKFRKSAQRYSLEI